MVTKAEAIHNGNELGKDYSSGHIDDTAMANFARTLRDVDSQDAKNHTHLKWDELSAASKSLEDKNVLPKLGFEDKAHHERVARVVGTTAESGKGDGERDIVVALGHKDATHAKDVVILGHDGKYYQAREVNGGFVKTDKVEAQNAAELEQKYKAGKLDQPLPKEASTEPKITKEPGSGRITSVRDVNGHERRFEYDRDGKLERLQMDGQTYDVGENGQINGRDGALHSVHTDANGRVIIDTTTEGNDTGVPTEQTCINTDGTIDQYKNGTWSHLKGPEANKAYAELQQQLRPNEALLA